MKLSINIKGLSRKKVIHQEEVELTNKVSTTKDLITELVKINVEKFNKKIDDYERRNCNKEEVIESLEKLVVLCEKAEKENKIIRCRKLTVKLTDNREER